MHNRKPDKASLQDEKKGMSEVKVFSSTLLGTLSQADRQIAPRNLFIKNPTLRKSYNSFYESYYTHLHNSIFSDILKNLIKSMNYEAAITYASAYANAYAIPAAIEYATNQVRDMVEINDKLRHKKWPSVIDGFYRKANSLTPEALFAISNYSASYLSKIPSPSSSASVFSPSPVSSSSASSSLSHETPATPSDLHSELGMLSPSATPLSQISNYSDESPRAPLSGGGLISSASNASISSQLPETPLTAASNSYDESPVVSSVESPSILTISNASNASQPVVPQASVSDEGSRSPIDDQVESLPPSEDGQNVSSFSPTLPSLGLLRTTLLNVSKPNPFEEYSAEDVIWGRRNEMDFFGLQGSSAPKDQKQNPFGEMSVSQAPQSLFSQKPLSPPAKRARIVDPGQISESSVALASSRHPEISSDEEFELLMARMPDDIVPAPDIDERHDEESARAFVENIFQDSSNKRRREERDLIDDEVGGPDSDEEDRLLRRGNPGRK